MFNGFELYCVLVASVIGGFAAGSVYLGPYVGSLAGSFVGLVFGGVLGMLALTKYVSRK